jgi:hypothetical protein
MTAEQRNSFRFYGGLFVMGCALLIIILQLVDKALFGEKVHLGIAVVLMSLGTVLMATSRRRSSGNKDKTA